MERTTLSADSNDFTKETREISQRIGCISEAEIGALVTGIVVIDFENNKLQARVINVVISQQVLVSAIMEKYRLSPGDSRLSCIQKGHLISVPEEGSKLFPLIYKELSSDAGKDLIEKLSALQLSMNPGHDLFSGAIEAIVVNGGNGLYARLIPLPLQDAFFIKPDGVFPKGLISRLNITFSPRSKEPVTPTEAEVIQIENDKEMLEKIRNLKDAANLSLRSGKIRWGSIFTYLNKIRDNINLINFIQTSDDYIPKIELYSNNVTNSMIWNDVLSIFEITGITDVFISTKENYMLMSAKKYKKIDGNECEIQSLLNLKRLPDISEQFIISFQEYLCGLVQLKGEYIL
jgi:hypothetical protein